MKIILASNNQGKIEDLKLMVSHLNVDVVSLNDLEFKEDIEEYGCTFFQNALIKAEYIAKLYPDCIVISDDSGLCVNHLDGAPGIYSARYSGGNDVDNNNLLLKNLKNVDDRSAYFISVLCIIRPNVQPQFFEGRVSGEILSEAVGTNGFGYDPIFSRDSKGSFAQLTIEQKKEYSHRGVAFKKLMTEEFWNEYA